MEVFWLQKMVKYYWKNIAAAPHQKKTAASAGWLERFSQQDVEYDECFELNPWMP